MSDLDPGAREQFGDVDACAVSDALDAAGLSGVALGLTRLSTRRRVHGRVITVQLGPPPANPAPAGRHLGTAAIEAAQPGDVIVVANGSRTDVAGWGGTLAAAAVQAGVSGVIIDGAPRDLDECEDLGLPVFGRNAVPVTARGRVVELSWNQPVMICGVSVAPGDHVVADGSGVVFVPAASAHDIAARATEIVARERRMVQDLRSGTPISTVMGATYETLLEERP